MGIRLNGVYIPYHLYTLLRPSGRKYNIRINIYAFVMYFNFSSLGMSFMRLFWLLGTADLGIPIFLPGGVSILEEFIG